MLSIESVRRQDHLKSRIERDERLQQILLVPEKMVRVDPLFWIFERKEDVVNVNNYPRAQQRKDLKIFALNISTNLQSMRRVDEEHVVFAERIEYVLGNFFHPFFDQPRLGRKVELQKILWVGFDCNEVARDAIFLRVLREGARGDQ